MAVGTYQLKTNTENVSAFQWDGSNVEDVATLGLPGRFGDGGNLDIWDRLGQYWHAVPIGAWVLSTSELSAMGEVVTLEPDIFALAFEATP